MATLSIAGLVETAVVVCILQRGEKQIRVFDQWEENMRRLNRIACGDEVLMKEISILAENAHDMWAAQRTKEGWTWGAKRDDETKKHPCLVSYADLPESEKEYDRQAAMGTLKAIIALGYGIEKMPKT